MKLRPFIKPTVVFLGVVCLAMPGPASLRFDGANDYVSFGVAPGLGVTNFTIECWFKRQGAGAATSTGTGGINAIPLVTKGRGENEAGVTNMNYFFGLETNNILAADFEDKNNGLNHPATNTTASVSNSWQHAAVTYQQNGTNGTWVMYLNGAPIKTNTFNGATSLVTTPEGNSIQQAALGSALTTAGTADGFFNGSMEEVRIWNSERNANQIATNMNRRIVSAANLIGRWPLTETSGTTANDTSGSGINGSLVNSPVWATDSPFAPPGTAGIIGNTNEATQTDYLWSGGAWINAGRFQAATNMTVSTMYAKVTAIPGRYKCAIYSESNSLPGRLLRSTVEVTNPAAGWQTFALTAPQALTNGNYYWLAIWSDDVNAGVYYSDTSGTLRWGLYNYGNWPDPIATTGGGDTKYCIYAKGTAATLVSIAVTPANTAITAGNSQQFTATGTYSDTGTQTLTTQVTWNSSNTAAATISSTGLATGVAAGTTTISATLSGVNGNTLLTVQPVPLNITTTTLPGGVTNMAYSATLTAIGGTPPYIWSLASGTLPAGLTLNTNSGAISGVPTAAGVSTFTARVTDKIAATDTAGPLSISIFSSLPPGTNFLFNFANVWRYQQLTNLDGTNWKSPGYNDSFWPAGPGVLAYETCGCLPQPTGTTLVTNENSLTYYFRTHFNFAGNPADVSLVLSNLIDDGAVFYLNGVEIARANMPAGAVTYTTLASTTVSDATDYTVLNISGDLLANLVAGDNVLAVEVHQINSTSSDIVFGSALCSVPRTTASGGLRFDGADDMVTMGVAPGLGVTNFTIECWFKQQGPGKRANTGTAGIYAQPLVTKGQAENDIGATNMNYFFGLGTNDSGETVLAADFEDFNNGLNHPVRGTAGIASNEWQHGAVTYNVASSNWVLYLNGVPDVTNVVSGSDLVRTPRYDSLQHAALGASLRTGGVTNADSGFFAGTLDEVRIWNYTRSAGQILTNYNRQIIDSPGLIARWSLDDAEGTTATNSVSGGVNGTLVNGPVWTDGYPFPPGPVNQPPAAPVPNAPANGATNVSASPTLNVTVSDPETNDVTVTFYGRAASAVPAGEDFTMGALPDTQFYSQTYSNIFRAQTEWIITNRVARNIAYVVGLGDIVNDGENGGNNIQWRNATNALYRLEDAVRTGLPNGIPYGTAVGNHDQTPNGSASGTTTFYNQYFGTNHFWGRPYYGGFYGLNNDNHFDLFSAGGMDFIVIYMEYDETMTTSSSVLAWANNVLATNQNRRAIVVSHSIIDAAVNPAFSAQGAAIYDALKGNTNLFLMLCGHVHGESQRTDVFNGCTIWSVLSDYQDLANGGSGWMRLYEFSPANSVIHVKTYSPWLDQWQTDADSQFDIPYAMSPANSFTAIATISGVTSGATASTAWAGLACNTRYEWYVTVNDGTTTTTGPVWHFNTGSNAPPVAYSQSRTNAEDTQLAITLTGYDPEGSNLTYSVVGGPTHGSISGTAPNLLFTPATNYHGPDSLTFVVNDGALTSAVATVSLTIASVNDAPIAGNAAIQVAADTATSITLPATDPDGDALTFSLGGLPAHGLVSNLNPANGTATYTPAHGYSGSDSVSFTATDGLLTSGTGILTITVQALADGNKNGMPDQWEINYGLWDPNADPDGDGMKNWQEYVANTNPTNAASVLRINSTVMAGNGHATISWQAVGGTRYRVEYSGSLGGSFTPIVRSIADEMNPASLGVQTTQSFTDDFTLTGGPPANRARFYRISVVQ
ncbi:MAG: LamG-like jellyroll fold domain-containing protein [Verrucomicrobiota bacterium]|jgi:hypothetical protein